MALEPLVEKRLGFNFQGFGNAPPTSGRWNAGDVIWNNAPAADAPVGWICTAGGAPGTWVPFGLIMYSTTLYPIAPGIRVTSGTEPPSTGTWNRGDICLNTQPSSGGVPGWVCVSGGNPGTWRAMATLASS